MMANTVGRQGPTAKSAKSKQVKNIRYFTMWQTCDNERKRTACWLTMLAPLTNGLILLAEKNYGNDNVGLCGAALTNHESYAQTTSSSQCTSKVLLDTLHREDQGCQVSLQSNRCMAGCHGSQWTTRWSVHACIHPAPAWTHAAAVTASSNIQDAYQHRNLPILTAPVNPRNRFHVSSFWPTHYTEYSTEHTTFCIWHKINMNCRKLHCL